MKLKLFRLANIFNPSFIRSFVVLFLVIILGIICSKFRIDFVFGGAFVLLIYSIIFPIMNYPKYIELNGNNINYVSPETLPIKKGKGFMNVNVKYQVTDITEFSLKQNKIERLLGLAHVIFIGKTNLDAGKHTDRFQSKDIHCVYGIIKKKHINELSIFAKELTLQDK